MKTKQLSLITTALLLIGNSAFAADILKPATADEYKLAQTAISSTYTTERNACNTLAGNAKDICVEEAKGHEKVAKAELEANYKPSEKNRYDLTVARADAAFAVAKEKCDDSAGNVKDVCRKQAEAVHTSAMADAKVAKKTADADTKANNKIADAVSEASKDKRAAAVDLAKEKCDALSGDAKSQCVARAKAVN